MAKTPRVSVVMSVYNGACYLNLALDSILAQEYPDFELVVVDDASTDTTARILDSYSDERLRVLKNVENMGLTRSLNRAAKVACGEFLARMDADDISLPGRLGAQVDFLTAHHQVGLLGTRTTIIDAGGSVVGHLRYPLEHADIMAMMLVENRFVHSSVMMRRELFWRVGGYNVAYRQAQDYELFLRLSSHARLANLATELQLWRRHNAGVSGQQRIEQLAAKERLLQGYLQAAQVDLPCLRALVAANLRNDPQNVLLTRFVRQMGLAE